MSKEEREFYQKNKAELCFNELNKLGFSITNTPWKNIYFDPAPKVKKADIPKFARIIRALALFERTGVVIADINRMGKVIGYHINTNK